MHINRVEDRSGSIRPGVNGKNGGREKPATRGSCSVRILLREDLAAQGSVVLFKERFRVNCGEVKF
jgi:hypothetical protein